MILFLLLLLEPSSILPPGGRVVPFRGITAPSAYCATAIIPWGPLFIFDDPAEEAECGESAGVVGTPRLGPVPTRPKGEHPQLGLIATNTKG
jgi:hypothetical protein